MYFKCMIDICDIDLMLSYKKYGFNKFIANKLGFYDDKQGFTYRIIEEEKKQDKLEEYLEELIDKRLYKEEQKELAEKVNIRKDGKLLKSINSINAYFEEAKLNYYILPKKSNSKRYWTIIKDVDK